MNEHLIIRNFGPVTSLDIDIKPFTVFIGEQGSGKSTISKVLTICRDLGFLFCLSRHHDTLALSCFEKYRLQRMLDSNENAFIEYQADGCWWRYENKTLYASQDESFLENKCSKIFQNYRKLVDEKSSSIGDNDVSSLQSNLNNFNLSRQTLLYIPSERVMATQLFPSLANVMLHNIPLEKPVLEYMSLFEKARKESLSYAVPFLGITYKYSQGKDMVEVDNNKEMIPMEEASSGIQSVLPLLMVFDYCSKQGYFNSFVIEEPEQNLFPSSQVELLRFILSRRENRDKNARFVITTHSPYMLSALNNYLYAAELANNPLVDKEEVDAVVPSNCQISIDDCAVYSLGKNLNGGEYCKSVISEETHLIDFNYLDKVSMDMGSEFDRLQNIYLNSLRKNRK